MSSVIDRLLSSEFLSPLSFIRDGLCISRLSDVVDVDRCDSILSDHGVGVSIWCSYNGLWDTSVEAELVQARKVDGKPSSSRSDGGTRIFRP